MTIAKRIVDLAMKQGFDEAVANVLDAKRTYLKVTNSRIDSIVAKSHLSASLFVSSKKRIFFTNINDFSDKGIGKALSIAKETIKELKPKEDYFGIAEGPFKYKKKSSASAMPEEKKVIDMAYGSIGSILSNGASNVAGAIYVSHSESELATSNGVNAKDSGNIIRMSMRAFEGKLSYHNYLVSDNVNSVNTKKFGKQTSGVLSSVMNTGKIENGNYDIIYTSPSGGSLVTNVNSFACMGNVETGSMFKGKMGKQIADKNVTVYDVGDIKGAVNGSAFDNEGVPTQKTPVIKAGKLVNYLHNTSTARKYKTKSTGNAGLVSPASNITLFEHKKKVANLNKLISKIDKGILVTNIWYTRFSNYLQGDFSTVPRDLAIYIEKGEPKFAIKQSDVTSILGIRISDNLVRMLNNIECAANDTIQTTSWESEGDYYYMPSILVKDVKVTTI